MSARNASFLGLSPGEVIEQLLLQGYSGAVAAYSLRKISGAYSGSAIRVRRGSDSVEQDIGFDNNELDTAALASFCSGTDGFVTTWYDQSGSANDTTQTATIRQPKIYDSSTGVVTENGKPAVQFDGVDDGLSLSSIIAAASQKYTFTTHAVDSGDVQWAIFYETIGSDVVPLAASGSTAGIVFGYTLNELYKNGITSLSGTRDDLYNEYTSGGQSLTTIDFSGDGVGGFFDRSAFVYQGTVQEIVIYDSNQSSNRTDIETNINDFYNIYIPFTTGLLDDYGGPAAAYSLRRLSSTYTGDAIRVRRASNSVEQDIGFDIEGNLNTSALASFCSGTDGFVTTWYDQSGNANDATQTSVGDQPKIYDSSTGVITENGKPAVEFLDQSINLFSSSASEFNNVLENELYCVASYGAINIGNQYAGGVQIGGSTRGVMIGTNSSGDEIRYHSDGSSFEMAAGGTISVDTQILHGGTYDGTTRHARLNGESVGTNTDAGATGTADAYFIGKHPALTASGVSEKKVQELILYPAYNGNESNIETNIGGYYTTNSPLLDTYTGAAAAYSLRKLSDSYSGSAIRVRRDGDSQEQDIGFNVFGGLDTAALDSFCSGANGFVTTWYDQSSNNNNATQVTPTLQPKIYDSSTGVVTENGKSAVNFDGSNDFLALGTATNLTNTNCQVIVTVYDTSTSQVKMPMGSSTTFWQHYNNNQVRVRTSSGDLPYTTGLPNGSQYVGVLNGTGTNYVIRQNGEEKISQSSTSNLSISEIGRGLANNSYAFDNNIQEIVIYESDKSSDLTGIETNINDFYTVWGTYNFDLTPVDIAFVGGQTEWDIVVTGQFSRESSATDAQRHTANMAVDGRDTGSAFNRLNLKTTVEIVDTDTQTTYTATGYLYITAPETNDGVINFRLSGQDASSVTFADLQLTATDFTPNLPDLTPAGQLDAGWDGRVTLEADPASPVVINGSTYNASSNNDWSSQPGGAYQAFFVLTT